MDTQDNLNTRLLQAAGEGNHQAIANLIDTGADVNAQTHDGWSVLLISTEHGPEIVNTLINFNANLDLASDRGYTPLMRAAGKGQEDVVVLLLDKGANPAAVDCNGLSGYRLSMEANQYDCANRIGDAQATLIIEQLQEEKQNEGFVLQAITHSERSLVDMTRQTVGGSVTRLDLILDDGSIHSGLKLNAELVLEIPQEVSEISIKSTSVPFEQN